MADRNTRIRGKQILEDSVEPTDLQSTNSPADNQVPSYDSATGQFTWETGGGGSDTGVNALVVAASDTPTTIKNRADYICDGTADQSEINTALGVADCVYLCPGTYYINASISIASNQTLKGVGDSTILKIPNYTHCNGEHRTADVRDRYGWFGLYCQRRTCFLGTRLYRQWLLGRCSY